MSKPRIPGIAAARGCCARVPAIGAVLAVAAIACIVSSCLSAHRRRARTFNKMIRA